MMKSLIVSGAFVVSLAAFVQPAQQPQVVATAGGSRILTEARLADLLGNSRAALEPEVARQVATLWANYHLLAIAGVANDSLRDRAIVEYAHWANINNLRYQMFREKIAAPEDSTSLVNGADEYARGYILSARHVLVPVDSTASPETRRVARMRIDSIRSILTPQNLGDIARSLGDANGGELGVFGRGDMVPAFERALIATTPGTFSPVVETEYGYHVIYRPPHADVAPAVEEAARSRVSVVAESTYVRGLEKSYRITVADGAVARARDIGRGGRGDRSVMARYTGGELTATEFADWIESFPASAGMVPRLVRGPDSMVVEIVRRIARNEVEMRRADSAGIRIDSTHLAQLSDALFAQLSLSWTPLRVSPSSLPDAETSTREARSRLAASRIEDYFDRMVKEEVPFVDVPVILARALRKKYSLTISDQALNRVVARARVVRATVDSVRATQAPVPGSNPAAVPTPGGLQSPQQLRTRPPG